MPRGRPKKNKELKKPAKQTKPVGRPRAKVNAPVFAIRHKEKRANIPTEELRGFMKDEEKAPAKMLYPRDPSLDPQLVWKGKDEQDNKDLAVPTVPVYIQEKIHPQAIIEDFKAHAKREKEEFAPTLFSAFNGIQFEELIEFYKHEQNWSNRMILGDSLLVMNSLSEKEGLKGKVQMVYIDPPYGIKFGSNWQVSTRKREVKDSKVEDATRQPEQIKAFRDTWELGIHSYLAYLRDRFVTSRDMLAESGSIFVQIGDENLHLVRCLLDEVFGSDNFCRVISIQKTGSIESTILGRTVDYILWYAKNLSVVKYRQLYLERKQGDTKLDRYDYVEIAKSELLRIPAAAIRGEEELPTGRRCRLTTLMSDGESKESKSFSFNGQQFAIRHGKHWKTDPEVGGQKLVAANRIGQQGQTLWYKRYVDDFPVVPLDDRWESLQIGTELLYVVQTAAAAVERCLLMTTDPGDLVLDPTCGSGTTAYVAEQWGRRWITIDTSRVALALARTRLMAARFPYYLPSDTPEGIVKEAEITGKVPPAPLPKTDSDIRKGFVYKRVPHITLKSIANNEEIDAIHARWQEQLEPVREKLNKAVKKGWQEWEIPRDADEKWSDTAKALHKQWWELRLARQKEIDESISRHADTELLYDQPYEDAKRVRVTGPFTVESLSPHRMLAPSVTRTASQVQAQKDSGAVQFEAMIIDNLRKAGVQNTIKNERLKFERLDAYSGAWINASGEYTDQGGKSRRVAVTIGPEHGTVGPDLVKEAAKEAVQGLGFEVLIVCGFSFDPHVSEEAKRYGNLTVLITRMNPDLAMGDELLKKTGAGNLFMVFGEPDIQPIDKAGKIIPDKNGKVQIEIKGVDVYDPTTGELRSNTTDDIACWFIDTEYNGESFFVRHAYFTGAGEPYERLKKALRAEVNESAWQTLYSTTSRPFDVPKTGKIAVKVINHYGDEVLKVFEVKK